MISLKRNVDPTNFPKSFTGDVRRQWELELLKQARAVRSGTEPKFSFAAVRWKDAKENLLLESFKKCAYCESYFSTVAFGDVEHYRPKSKYWWLAYAYFNYAASCQLCNQKYKRTRFPVGNTMLKKPPVRKNSTDAYLISLAGKLTPDPLDDTNGIPLQDFIKLHNQERPLSIDPYVDDPTEYFAYEYNDQTREVILVPLNDEVGQIATSCIDLFGLNRKELRDLRYRGLLRYRIIRQFMANSSDPIDVQAGANVIKEEFLHPKVEYSGMYRYFEGKGIAAVL